MNTTRRVLFTSAYLKTINWKLLLFLLMFLHVKLVVKLAALVFIYLADRNVRFGLRWKDSRLPLFYPLIIILAIINSLLYQQIFQSNYLFVLGLGIAIWICCLLSVHQLKLQVEKSDPAVIYRTLVIFFLANIFVSLFEFVRIMLETGTFNPFRYQGNYQKYFINTGDYINGISFDTSTTNAVINSFGVIFFLWKRSWAMVLACMAVLLLTASNMVNLLLCLVLLFLFAFKTAKEQKSIVIVCFAFLAVFITKVSPQNNQYVHEVMERILPSLKTPKIIEAEKVDVRNLPDDLLSAEQQREKVARIYLDSMTNVFYGSKGPKAAMVASESKEPAVKKPLLPAPDIHSAPYQNRNDTNEARKEILSLLANKKDLVKKETRDKRLPGKAESFLQTYHFLKEHPEKLLTGIGLGNFSSKTAFKATGLRSAGSYPKSFQYIHPDFAANHLPLYLHFFSEHSKKHSITNSPNSLYDQLLSEYGIIGLSAFLVFYVGFFLRYRRKMTYSLPLLFILLGIFIFDYWFEQLSVVVFFELLYFLDIKENQQAV